MLSFVKNRKGGNNLQDANGYLYRVSKVVKDRSYWHCVAKKSDACPATAITVSNSNILVSQQGDHTHSNRLVERKVKEVEIENIAAAALLPTVTPRTILGAISSNLEANLPGTSAFISNRNAINQAVHKKRKLLKGYPPKAKVFEDLVNIPEHFSKTADGKPFLVLNDTVIPGNSIPNAPRILVFISDAGKEVLASCETWYIDGTFKAAENTLFSQVVFIVGLTGMDKAIPCAFALLPSKEKESYQRLATSIKEELTSQGNIKMKCLMMDYERGLINAFQETFHEAKVEGCEFHWKSCLRKRLASEGLLDLYNKDVEFILLIRYIWALAFVPEDMVVKIWETVIGEKVRLG
jgi:hypothetical protein